MNLFRNFCSVGSPCTYAVTGGLAIIGGTADNQDRMNGIGVGLSVALGAGIGARLAVPDLYTTDLLMGMIGWGLTVGFIFHLYKVALHRAHLPFGRH